MGLVGRRHLINSYVVSLFNYHSATWAGVYINQLDTIQKQSDSFLLAPVVGNI